MDSKWVSVFQRELNRRRRAAQQDLELYKKVHAVNPKGLLAEDKCAGHCWVPATHLMIHDNVGKGWKIGGITRRGFREAYPYKDENYDIVPQMCWYCDAYREFQRLRVSAAERIQQFKAERPKKPKGRMPNQQIESVIDDSFYS